MGHHSTRVVACAIAMAVASLAFAAPQRAPAQETAFDELYRRGQRANAGLKTLTGHFVETTTSSLLTRPIIERGTLAVERPSRVVLHYTTPDDRTVLIDGDRMILSWPAKNIQQVKNIRQIQGRVQKYFVDSNPDELRKSFEISMVDVEQRPGADHVVLLPKRQQIREGLTRLDLWIVHTSLLLGAMRMTFASGDTKLMTLEDVVPNAPLSPGTFSLPMPAAR